MTYEAPLPKVVSKRTGKTTVAIVGFAASTRHEAPWEDEDTEIWGLNEGYKQDWMKRWSRWFQIHPVWDYMRYNNRNDWKHVEWLRSAKGFPIYLQFPNPEVPAGVRYPIEEVIMKYGQYLTSSIAYMVALALLEGFERIEIYGVEMLQGSEYGYQRPCVEYYLGIAKALGVEVYLPQQCYLLRGNLYGYEEIRIGDRTWLEMRRNVLTKQEKTRMEILQRKVGAMNELKDVLRDMTVDGMDEKSRWWMAKRLDAMMQDTQTAMIAASGLNGCLQEIQNLISWHDAQNIPADREHMLRKVGFEYTDIDLRVQDDLTYRKTMEDYYRHMEQVALEKKVLTEDEDVETPKSEEDLPRSKPTTVVPRPS